MDDGQKSDTEEPNTGQEEEDKGLQWLLGTDSLEIIPAPMDTNVCMLR